MASRKTIGNYRIEGIIGRGGMGVVYRGHHLQLPREVAIKSIDARNPAALNRLKHRFEKEAFIQSQLDHRGIVKVYDYIVEENAYFIVMEYVEGRSLAQLLSQSASTLHLNRVLNFFEQMLAAISYAHTFVYRDQDGSSHRGLVHRDLKPANILITPENIVKITDFGIVKLVGAAVTDTLSDSYGSPEYVSPEQAEGLSVDQRSDIYSLGVILYEMLTGTTPFCNSDKTLAHMDIVRMHIEKAPPPPSERQSQVTPEMEAVILRALEKSPSRRFQTAQEFLQAVRAARTASVESISQPKAENTLPLERRIDQGEDAYGATTLRSTRESYVTQPIGTRICAECGAPVAPGEEICRTCGHELNSSPATSKLSKKEAAGIRKRRMLDIRVAATLFALALAVSAVLYMRRTTLFRHQAQPEASTVAEAPKSTPAAPAHALIELKPAIVEVDSSFDGYSAAPLTDGEIDIKRIGAMRYNLGNWASAETQTPHWITLDFERPVHLAAVYIYWGFDRNRYMPSRRVELQLADESNEWRTISVMEPRNDYDRMAFDFAPVSTRRVRILQPAQQGPANRPFVMWVREVKSFVAIEDDRKP